MASSRKKDKGKGSEKTKRPVLYLRMSLWERMLHLVGEC